MRRRNGFALLELLMAAVLGSAIIGIAVTLLQVQGAAARAITMRSERNDAVRSAFAILQAEFGAASIADVHAFARDSFAARIFRGFAEVCGFNGPDVFVRYRGLRLPDPAKDSALQLGPENVVAVQSVRADSTACTARPGEQVLALHWAAAPRVGAAWLVFESGSYHLSTEALRYRQGAASKQPITNQVFDDGRSAFAVAADSLLRRIDVALHDRNASSLSRGRLHLLNRP